MMSSSPKVASPTSQPTSASVNAAFANAASKQEKNSGEENRFHQIYGEALENFRAMRPRPTLALFERKLKLPTISEIVRRSSLLCEDYIYSRLRQPEVVRKVIANGGVSSQSEELKGLRQPSDVSLEIQRLGAMMESKYPSLYCNISRQIMMPLRSDVAVRKAMVCIGDYMFAHSVVTWGRIIGLFAIAGAMAAECVEMGNSQHIRTIVTVFSELIERHASQWILRQGGWVRIVTAFRSSTEMRGMWVLTAVGALLGFVVTWSLQS